jgi:hypothetical protein
MDFLKMTEKEIIEKIYRNLDGELTKADQCEIEDYLSDHPEAAQLSKEWELIKIQMNKEQKAFVDIDLKQEILKRINMETYKQPPKTAGFLIVRSFWSRPAVRLGFSFVLGVFVGIIIFSFLKVDFKKANAPTKDMKGTFYDSRSFDNMKVADVLQYEDPLTKAVCNVRYSTKIVEIRVDISSLNLVKSIIEFDYNDFKVLNVQNVSVNDQSSAVVAANLIQINNIGDNKFIIQLYNKNSLSHNIDFKIYQNDLSVYHNSVQVNKE